MLFSAILLAVLAPTFLSMAYSAAVSSKSKGYSGDGTFYMPGLGACGKTNKKQDLIVAVGHNIFDSYPGANLSNLNKNAICGKKLRATYGQKSVVVAVEDRCTGCPGADDLDFTETGFAKLASPTLGRIRGVKWEWV
ncbi:RlpA-like double-psi beta-barrel-protein domain-containing protein-containing protein [Mycena capillaripes]|nr:RlpA-like double-psi beta-barrel-protein domain-containing protein-containing protein [Mycena capillaripes]